MDPPLLILFYTIVFVSLGLSELTSYEFMFLFIFCSYHTWIISSEVGSSLSLSVFFSAIASVATASLLKYLILMSRFRCELLKLIVHLMPFADANLCEDLDRQDHHLGGRVFGHDRQCEG
jgi:hypothetical protein